MRSLLTLATLLILSHDAFGQTPDAESLDSLREEISPIDFTQLTMSPERTRDYFGWYGLDVVPKAHYFGSFRSNGFTLAAHALVPEGAHSTVIVLHGYLDHTGSHGATIRHLLEQGYAVAAYDQPGHGLSSGRRASIEDFADYVAVFDDFEKLCRAHMPQPCHVLAHSTGASIVADRLLQGEPDELGEIVLVAPLVRSAKWAVSKTMASVFAPFIDDFPRIFRHNTSDEAYAEFVKRDPLQPRQAAIDWFEALVEWNKQLSNHEPSNRSITIIQGDEDSTVDWKFNIELLAGLFTEARIEIITDGRHQLLNESVAVRSEVLAIVDEVLARR